MEDNFLKPKGFNELLEDLTSFGENGRIIAGGTDLIIEMRSKRHIPKTFIDISHLSELKKIEVHDGIVSVGACCTHSEIEKNEIIKKYAPILAKGCSMVGSTLVRNRGTIGGNIVNNSSCADSVPPLLVMDAKVNIVSEKEHRSMKLEDFFLDKGKVQLKNNEILTSIEFKPISEYTWEFTKVGRRKSLAISRLTLAMAFIEKDNTLEDIRICPGAVMPKPQRLHKLEELMKGKNINEDSIKAFAEEACREVTEVTGIRWSSEYKNLVLKGLIIRTLEGL